MRFAPLLIVILGAPLNLWSQVSQPLLTPREITQGLATREDATVKEIRDRLADYLSAPNPELREAALLAASRVEWEPSEIALVAGRFMNEDKANVRGVIVSSLARYVEADHGARSLIVSAIRKPYEQDDLAAAAVARNVKIPELEHPLQEMVLEAELVRKTTPLEALLAHFGVSPEFRAKLDVVLQQAEAETASAMPLFSRFAPEERERELARLPSRRLETLIKEIPSSGTTPRVLPGDPSTKIHAQGTRAARQSHHDSRSGESSEQSKSDLAEPPVAAMPSRPRYAAWFGGAAIVLFLSFVVVFLRKHRRN